MKTVSKLLFIPSLLMGIVSCSDPGKEAFDTMIDCRDKFNSTFRTISSSAESLTDSQRLEMVGNAVMQRQKCELEGIKK